MSFRFSTGLLKKCREKKYKSFLRGLTIIPYTHFKTPPLPLYHLYKWWVVGLHYLKSTLEKFCFFPLHLLALLHFFFFLDFLCMAEGGGWQFFFCHPLDTQNTYNKRRNSMLLVYVWKQVSDSLKKSTIWEISPNKILYMLLPMYLLMFACLFSM